MTYPEGSTWRRWDLHVHTPESHTAHYGGSSEDSWERFLTELSRLPSDMSVLGINDYMWVDGYERVLQAHSDGRLPNIEAIFPVVELRLHDFIGSDQRLSRLNAHAIFAPGTDPDLIRGQFIPRLIANFTLSDQYSGLSKAWNAVPTKESLADLGSRIKSTVDESELAKYGPDLVEGFNNWVIPLSSVKDALADSSFSERPLLAIGKTEWESIPWNDNTIAAKKNLISSADFVFTAADSAERAIASSKKLRESNVNHRVLDCSDAHHYSDSEDKDRLGNCCTWICADPTLAGLKHALLEYDGRVYLGGRPPLLVHQETDPTNFYSRIRISPVDPSHTPSPSFDIDIPLNRGFVAVIGNKGSGKSALLDTMALGANSHVEGEFTFLSERRFRSVRNNMADHYLVELLTADGESTGRKVLSDEVDPSKPERVRYLPQSMLERLCNKEPGTPDDAFEAELRAIIYSHVPEHQRLGCGSLDELLEQRGGALDREMEERRGSLADINRRIAGLEDAGRPSRVRALRKGLAALEDQLRNHEAAKPPDPELPGEIPSQEAQAAASELDEVRAQLEKLGIAERTNRSQYAAERSKLDAGRSLIREVASLQGWFSDFEARATDLANAIGLDLADIVNLEVNIDPVSVLLQSTESSVASLDTALSPKGEMSKAQESLIEKQAEIEGRLNAPQRKYEEERRQLESWDQARRRLIGDSTTEGTLSFYATQLESAEAIPERLKMWRANRMELTKELHSLLLDKVAMHRELYGPVQEFLRNNKLAQEHFSLEFEAELEVVGFDDRFFSFVDRGASGSFYGVEASSKRVMDAIKVAVPGDWDSMEALLRQLEDDLHVDRRQGTGGPAQDSPADGLRKGVKLEHLYDYLYGLTYLDAHYELRSDGRAIGELSPGQKGTILLMFYLLVDQSGRPIALDQPDENLDNHTVHTLLRPAIRAARKSRQVLVVTHSPNLAVVGDADQVIVACCDGERFEYRSGAIESPEIRDLVVNVLEGTWPAFEDRQRKYSATEMEQ
jgi:ABC-type lipoprotein export system ATPase subunit